MVRRLRHFAPALLLLFLFLFLFLLVLATGTAGAAEQKTVTVARVPGAGSVLVDGATGRTLYTLTDASGHGVACTGACLRAWPALSVGAGAQATAPKGVKGVSATADGGVASRGLPLSLFSGDLQAGTANGNGAQSFGGTWRVVHVTGRAAKGAPPAKSRGARSTTATTNPATGYGY